MEKIIEPDFKLRVLELRMRAADLELMLSDTASLAADRGYYYIEPPEEEEEPQQRQREAIAAELRLDAERMLEIIDGLVNLTRIGGPLSIADPLETVLRGN